MMLMTEIIQLQGIESGFLTYADIKDVLRAQNLEVVGTDRNFQKNKVMREIAKKYDFEYTGIHGEGLEVYKLKIEKIEPKDENKIMEIWLPKAYDEGIAGLDSLEDKDFYGRLEIITGYKFPVVLIISERIDKYISQAPKLFDCFTFKMFELLDNGVERVDMSSTGKILDQQETKYKDGKKIPMNDDLRRKHYIQKVDLQIDELKVDESNLLDEAINSFNQFMCSVEKRVSEAPTTESV